jgi:hypothetical protein
MNTKELKFTITDSLKPIFTITQEDFKQMDTKEKADALVEKHYNAIRTDIDIFDTIKLSILSVEHTIEVFARMEYNEYSDFEIYNEQTEILNELKSRI